MQVGSNTPCHPPRTVGRKELPETDFGTRLAAIRKAKGVTQVELAKAIHSQQRAISYYESEGGHAPLPVLVQIAKALRVSTDELLGLETKGTIGLEDRRMLRLWKRFQLLLQLPDKDQRAVLRLLDTLRDARGVQRKAKDSVRKAG